MANGKDKNLNKEIARRLSIMEANHGSWIRDYANQARRLGKHPNTYAVCQCSRCRLSDILEAGL